MEVLDAVTRENSGNAREIRRTGYVPGIIYGSDKKEIKISILLKELTRLYHKGCFKSTVVEVNLEGQKYQTLPKALQFHPVSDVIEHIDFIFLGEKEQKVDVKIQYEGAERSVGVKKGGFFNIINRTIPVIADVKNIPQSIKVDVSKLKINDALTAHELTLPEGCRLIKKENFIIATITGRGGKKDEEEEAGKAATPAK